MKPSVGRIVHTIVDPALNNGADVAPAIITRVWSDTTVNLRVMYDGASVDWITSASLHADEDAARERVALGASPQKGHNAFWPPRV